MTRAHIQMLLAEGWRGGGWREIWRDIETEPERESGGAREHARPAAGAEAANSATLGRPPSLQHRSQGLLGADFSPGVSDRPE